jgi:hypothetical protein
MWALFTKTNYKRLRKQDIPSEGRSSPSELENRRVPSEGRSSPSFLIPSELKNRRVPINNNFINKIKEIRKIIYNMNTIDYEITEYNIPLNKLNELLGTRWVMKNLELNNLDHNICIKWKNKDINNFIYLKINKIKFNNFLERLPIFLKICNYIQDNSSISIQIYLILSPHKKYIKLDEIISPKHINSGYTHNLNYEICVWREEEFEKVSFHELFHLFEKDHRNENINYKTDINFDYSQYFEAITDFKAIIINIIYLSLLTYKKIMFILKYEYKFIYNQAKLINSNLQNIQNQNTPAYSYFILKYYIFKYFIEEDYDIDILNDLLHKNINYNKLINNIMDYKLNESEYINFNSGRMTFFELK